MRGWPSCHPNPDSNMQREGLSEEPQGQTAPGTFSPTGRFLGLQGTGGSLRRHIEGTQLTLPAPPTVVSLRGAHLAC